MSDPQTIHEAIADYREVLADEDDYWEKILPVEERMVAAIRADERAAPASVVEAVREWMIARDALFDKLHKYGILEDRSYSEPYVADALWCRDVDGYEAVLAALRQLDALGKEGVGE